jgi:plasmid stability protein
MTAGLVIRPLEDTIRETLAWDRARGRPAREGLSSEDEARLLN